ncbi:alpha/beta fold hydrolase [Ruicaihuangia caeni]|uniref:Alpha/beta hydrolase n=1 Tax=Ruicaihuangia caeni TaxID=3042517 RepID=A0AAW6T7E2_9MICO|nr:alpha/beta hydrolase [Klugiella sp. YN-L-19]MDI2098606.1 alpha/beta hydrolase [Klugiella sp. YN-L-19]
MAVESQDMQQGVQAGGFEDRRVNTGDIELQVRVRGTGDTTVFLFHGVTANLDVWRPIAEDLAAQFTVVAVDQRGHGRSDKPASGYTHTDYSNDVIALVEQLGGNGGKDVVVGHSLGSRNATVATARRPDLIDGFVGIDFTPFIETEVFDSLEARVNGGDQHFADRDAVIEYLQNRYQKIPREAIVRRADYGYVRDGDGLRPLASPEAMAQTVTGLRADLAPFTEDVARPALYIRGAESTLVTQAAFEATRRLRPDLGYQLVDDADHYVPEEQPRAIADSIRSFIAGL